MFQAKANPTFESFVSGFVPGQPDAGMNVEFLHKTQEEVEAWRGSFKSEPLVERMTDVIKGWSDAPVAYSAAELKTLANEYPGLPGRLFEKYIAGLHGAAQKN